MPGIAKKRFQSDQSMLEPEPDTETHTGLVRPAQNPGIISRQSVSPQRSFTDIKRDVGGPNRHDGPFRIRHRMDCLESGHKLCSVDLQFRSTPLKSRLRFSHAVLDSLDAVAARKCAPRAHPKALQDSVGIEEKRTAMASHGTSQLDRGLNPMGREEVGKIINRQVQQRARSPCRDAALVNSEANHFHERL